jgi:uncharacterized protein (DUF1015 family)
VAVIEPFRGLRYDPNRVIPSDVIAPPYDVVSDDAKLALLASSPYNIAHVESVPGGSDSRYEAAAQALRQWEDSAVLLRDARPAYYAYEQKFAVPGEARTLSRRGFFTRLRLTTREEGIVRPHEATMSAAKEDRLKLLKATHTNVSPIFAMYSDADGTAASIFEAVTRERPAFEARDGRGDEHRLWVIDDPGRTDALTRAVAASNVTIADGHHRYETALNFLRERSDAASEAERSLLTGLVAQEDPGLIVLPIHRLIRNEAVPSDLATQIEELYRVEDAGEASDAAAADRLYDRVREAKGTTFGVLGLVPKRLHLLTARSPHVANALPAQWSAASRALDVLVLNQTILEPMLGLDAAARAAAERIGFTESVPEAWHAVHSGEYRLAFLVQAVRVEQIVAVADAGELLPQKSTYFYPKMATGMVLNPLD